jgi:hypothetical protein
MSQIQPVVGYGESFRAGATKLYNGAYNSVASCANKANAWFNASVLPALKNRAPSAVAFVAAHRVALLAAGGLGIALLIAFAVKKHFFSNCCGSSKKPDDKRPNDVKTPNSRPSSRPESPERKNDAEVSSSSSSPKRQPRKPKPAAKS